MEKENLCPICFTDVEGANFCSACGEPISDLAKDLVKEQKSNYELAILVKLIDYIKDERDLKFIKGLISKLSDEE